MRGMDDLSFLFESLTDRQQDRQITFAGLR